MTARQLRRITPVMGRYGLTLVEPSEPPEALAWQEFALCAETDPEQFFPAKGQPSRPAKQVCWSCPVRRECLEDALTHEVQWGVWGGLSALERRKLKRQAVAS